jgi:hypothetical protein
MRGEGIAAEFKTLIENHIYSAAQRGGEVNGAGDV